EAGQREGVGGAPLERAADGGGQVGGGFAPREVAGDRGGGLVVERAADAADVRGAVGGRGQHRAGGERRGRRGRGGGDVHDRRVQVVEVVQQRGQVHAHPRPGP